MKAPFPFRSLHPRPAGAVSRRQSGIWPVARLRAGRKHREFSRKRV